MLAGTATPRKEEEYPLKEARRHGSGRRFALHSHCARRGGSPDMAKLLASSTAAAQVVAASDTIPTDRPSQPLGAAGGAGSTGALGSLGSLGSDTALGSAGCAEAAGSAGAAGAVGDMAEMTKPGITLMVVLTSALGYLLAGGTALSWQLVATLVGTGLVAAGASVLNQFWERGTDALMRRTAGRPLPAGRLDPDVALLLGVGLGIAGLLELALAVNALTSALGAVALAGYVFVYTPLKKVSSLATVVGAIPGALPPMMGWCAVRGEIGLAAWVLFGILFFWQMPHFLAIAWLCREDYARGGFPMLPVIDPAGTWTARQSVLYGAALVPVSLLPSLLGLAGRLYFAGALLLGLAYLGFCLGFARHRSTVGARRLMFASLLYLPAVLMVLLLDRVIA
jgi:heme o synthase